MFFLKKIYLRYVSFELYPGDFYPFYMKGAFYMLTNKAIEAILKETFKFKAIPIEDLLFTGIIAKHVNASLINSSKYIREGNV